jgi:(p)ppGpp synthase/HD superfamily hydrolase
MFVGILHDILEETSVTKEDLLNMGFDEYIVESIDVLTKKKKQDYMDYIKCIKNNRRAREIKLIDLKDNINLTRLEIVTEKDLKNHMNLTYK